jgi:hypothetical protein
VVAAEQRPLRARENLEHLAHGHLGMNGGIDLHCRSLTRAAFRVEAESGVLADFAGLTVAGNLLGCPCE